MRDGKHVIAAHISDIEIYNTSTWELVTAITGAATGGLTDVAVSPSQSFLAATSREGFLRVFTFDGEPVQAIPLGGQARNVEFLTDAQLLAGTLFGPVIVVTHDVDELFEIARSRLTHSFTAVECETYRFDPCPTLEEFKSGPTS